MVFGLSFVLSFAFSIVLAMPLIAWLRRLSYRQIAYEDAPKTHASKSGTPTMGGLLFAVPLIVAAAITRLDATVFAIVVLAVLCGLIGAADDLAKIRGARNRGMRAPLKFALTGVAAFIFIALLGRAGDPAPYTLFVPFLGLFGGESSIAVAPWIWIALSVCVVVASVHAVNLTDGLDGLAAGTVVPPLLALTILAVAAGKPMAGVVAIATVGAALGFLFYNHFPARVFMGDTGSLALGGVLAGTTIASDAQLLLPLIGGIFVAEAFSVILQVITFKTTHKRIFRMSPLHHHYELGGWPETKVTHRFWATSAFLSLLGVLSIVPKPA